MDYLSLFNKLEIDFFNQNEYMNNQCILFKLKLKEKYMNYFQIDYLHYGDVYLNRDTKEIFIFLFREVSTNFYDSHYFYGFEFISTTVLEDELQVNPSLSIDEMLNNGYNSIEYVGNIILDKKIVLNEIESLNNDTTISNQKEQFIESLRYLIIQKLDLIFIYYKCEKSEQFISVNNLKKATKEKFKEIENSIKKYGFLLLCNIFETKKFVGSLCLLENNFGFVSINEQGEIVFVSKDGQIVSDESLLIKDTYNYYNTSETDENNRRENVQEECEIYRNHFLYLVSQI